MDKITFIIPNNKENKILNQQSVSLIDIKEENIIDNVEASNTNKQLNINNITSYVKIAPNVYMFGTHCVNIEDNIYLLYSNACQIKQENKYIAIEMFQKCYKLMNELTNKEISYQICINLALLVSETNGTSSEIYNYYDEALKICSDRAEPYYYCSIYCNKVHNFEKSYELLKKALLLSYDNAKNKYQEVQFTAYGKYLYDELAISCYRLKKYDEAKLLLEQIIDDPELNNIRERTKYNLELTKKELENFERV